MSDTDEIILVRRFNDLDANPKVFRCRKSALLTITKYSDIPGHFCYACVHGQSSRSEAGL
jgi:hypothetical protein